MGLHLNLVDFYPILRLVVLFYLFYFNERSVKTQFITDLQNSKALFKLNSILYLNPLMIGPPAS